MCLVVAIVPEAGWLAITWPLALISTTLTPAGSLEWAMISIGPSGNEEPLRGLSIHETGPAAATDAAVEGR